MSTGRKQRFFESDDDYRERMTREADEGRIERTTGDAPSQGFFESDEGYEDRISREADEGVIEDSSGSKPSQGWCESDDRYEERIEREANERTIEDVTGDAPSQCWFESDGHYERRIEREADEATIERSTGEKPSQGWLESDSDYAERISCEADEHDSDDSSSSSSGGCFLTTACVESAGLPDDCRELTVLRRFRDGYVAHLPDGAALIAEYYATAPHIVARIQRSPDRIEALGEILSEVRCAVVLIEGDRPEEALAVYAAMFRRLRVRFADRITEPTASGVRVTRKKRGAILTTRSSAHLCW
jgi:hypothetical protein